MIMFKLLICFINVSSNNNLNYKIQQQVVMGEINYQMYNNLTLFTWHQNTNPTNSP